VAFTDAGAGNLALHVGDDPAEVRRRRELLESASGIKPRHFQYMNQVHGSDVLILENGTATHEPAAPTADGLVSRGTPFKEQLGLELKPSTAPVEVLIIDRIERPSAN